MSNKIRATAIMYAFLMTAISTRAGQFEVRGGSSYYLPYGAATEGGEETFFEEVKWDKGLGYEVQGIFWGEVNAINKSVGGFGVSFGASTWDIEDYAYTTYYQGLAFSDTLAGDADLTQIGLFVICKDAPDQEKKFGFDSALGVKYIRVDSNISGQTGVAYGSQALVWDQTLEIGDCWVGFLDIGCRYNPTKVLGLFATVGWQFDIVKGEVENECPGLGTYKSGDAEMAAFYGKAGVSVTF